MTNFTKFFLSITLLLSIALPIIASYGAWGIGSEQSALIEKQRKNCAANLKDNFGNCKRTHRSNHSKRSYYGGGLRGGK